jgi:hypothetical protein
MFPRLPHHLEMKLRITWWIIQVILAIKLIGVTYTHCFRQSQPLLHMIAACALAGSLRLIQPGVLGCSTWITPATAVILSTMLLISIPFHVRNRDKPKIFASVVLFGMAAFIAFFYG